MLRSNRITIPYGVLGLILSLSLPAQARHESVVFDNHPTGGAGATGKRIVFPTKNPPFKIEPPGKCGEPFIGGFAFGHRDPRLKNPEAVCGHGIVVLLSHPPDVSTSLILLPASSPVAPKRQLQAAAEADATRVIRRTIPDLDTPRGDAQPPVLELRLAVQTSDVMNASRYLPRPRSAR